MLPELLNPFCLLLATMGLAAMYGWAAYDCWCGDSLKSCIRAASSAVCYTVLFLIKLYETADHHQWLPLLAEAEAQAVAPPAYIGLIL
ncbi:MAG: hypothetical protein GKS00_08470 [Alphaproteobacteria bacterium]|nr:hypothetical protein [Alphaproteobacteria bacterium]